jgi:hypothetical protein
MNYKITSADGTIERIQITSDYFKKWKVWKIGFKDGKVAMLFKVGTEWMQGIEDTLDEYLLTTIGNCIDEIIASNCRMAFK